MHQVASFQIFLRDNKPKMNSRYPFLTPNQIMSRLRQQWKQMDETKRILFSKLVVSKKVNTHSRSRSSSRCRIKMAVHPAIAKPRQPFTNRLVKGLLDLTTSTTDLCSTSFYYEDDNDFVSDYSDGSIDEISNVENKFTFGCLSQQSQLKVEKTYSGRVFALHDQVPDFVSAEIGRCASGILKLPRNAQKTQRSRVTFSPFAKTIHIRRDNFYLTDSDEDDGTLFVETASKEVITSEASLQVQKELPGLVKLQGRKPKNGLEALSEDRLPTHGRKKPPAGEKKYSSANHDSSTAISKLQKENKCSDKRSRGKSIESTGSHQNKKTGDIQSIAVNQPQNRNKRSLGSRCAASQVISTKPSNPVKTNASKPAKSKLCVNRSDRHVNITSTFKPERSVDHEVPSTVSSRSFVTKPVESIQAALPGKGCEPRLLRMTPERARRQLFPAAMPVQKKIKTTTNKGEHPLDQINLFSSRSPRQSQATKPDSLCLSPGKVKRNYSRHRQAQGRRPKKVRDKTTKVPSVSSISPSLVPFKTDVTNSINNIRDDDVEDFGFRTYDDDDDAVLLHRPDIYEDRLSEAEQNDSYGDLNNTDQMDTDGAVSVRTQVIECNQKSPKNSQVAAYDELLKNYAGREVESVDIAAIPVKSGRSKSREPRQTRKTSFHKTRGKKARVIPGCQTKPKKDVPRKKNCNDKITSKGDFDFKGKTPVRRTQNKDLALYGFGMKDENMKHGLDVSINKPETSTERRVSVTTDHEHNKPKQTIEDTHCRDHFSIHKSKANRRGFASKQLVLGIFEDDDDARTGKDHGQDMENTIIVDKDATMARNESRNCSLIIPEHARDKSRKEVEDTYNTDDCDENCSDDNDDDADDIFCSRIASQTNQTLQEALKRLQSLTSPNAYLPMQCSPVTSSACSPESQNRDNPSYSGHIDGDLGCMFQNIEQHDEKDLTTPARRRLLASAHQRTSSNFMQMFESQDFFL